MTTNTIDENGVLYIYNKIKGEMPAKTSDLINDSTYQTAQNVADSITAALGTLSIPTKTSDLQNDSGFQNATQVQTAINTAIAGISNLHFDVTFGFGIPYRYVIRAYSTGGYTDSDPERICYQKTAVVLDTDDAELIIDRSEDKYLPYTADISGDMAIFNCVGRELPLVEHGETEMRAFKSKLYIKEGDDEKLAKMAKKNKIFYRDYSGRAFPVAINPPINYSRWMNDGYIADIQFLRIAEQEVIVNV